jgi:multisubunit Na+/H+ antiporter MnhG subunit
VHGVIGQSVLCLAIVTLKRDTEVAVNVVGSVIFIVLTAAIAMFEINRNGPYFL